MKQIRLFFAVCLALAYAPLARAACTLTTCPISPTISFPAGNLVASASAANATQVQYFVDGNVAATGFSAPTFAVSPSAPIVGPGQHVVFARATCSCGTQDSAQVGMIQTDSLGCQDNQGGCAITSGGVDCWGDNSHGQLGNGTTTSSLTHVPVSGVSSARSIACGDMSRCVVQNGGVLKCWGYNVGGQVGDGTTTDRTSPVTISFAATQVSMAMNTTCAADVNGQAKCWGENAVGQVGDGTTTERHTPTAVSGLSSGTVMIAPGWGGTVALVSGGTLRVWGDLSTGEKGDGTTSSSPALTPIAVSNISGVTDVSYGSQYLCAVTGSALKCWGSNAGGNLGVGDFTARLTPTTAIASGVQSVAAGKFFTTCAVVNAGLQCFGFNDYGGVGSNDPGTFHTSPVGIGGFSGFVFQAIPGVWNMGAWSGGHPYVWGWNQHGGLGDGSTTERDTPVRVSGL